MPKKSARPSLAEMDAAPGGAAAVDRALSVLKSFRTGDATLSLAELSDRTVLYKSTLLRLLASLEHNRLVQRFADGRYGLGPEVSRLNAIYAALIPHARSETSPSGSPNSNVFSVIDTMV